MSRKHDLENDIRSSYKLIRDYEQRIRLSSTAKEKQRYEFEKEHQIGVLVDTLSEYINLVIQLNETIPRDIYEIHLGFSDVIKRHPDLVITLPPLPDVEDEDEDDGQPEFILITIVTKIYDKTGRVIVENIRREWRRLSPREKARLALLVAIIGCLGAFLGGPAFAELIKLWISKPTPTSTPTLTITPMPTSIIPATRTPTLSAISTPSITPIPTLSIGDCDVDPLPCNYRIRYGDTFFQISVDYYGSKKHAPIILSYNRDELGYSRPLTPGEFLFLPSLEALPSLPYPTCDKQDLEFPCLYRAYRGDTYESIAQDFYGNIALSDLIESANFSYDPVFIRIIPPEIEEGIVLVLPIIQ